MRTRRSFTPEFKARIVLDLLTGAPRMAQACREFGLKEQVILRWNAALLARAATLFAQDPACTRDQTRIAELERLVGRLTMELEIANTASQHVTSAVPGNGR